MAVNHPTLLITPGIYDDDYHHTCMITIYRDCKGMHRLCVHDNQPYILFGWGRNASGIQLPQGNICIVTVYV